MKGISVIGAAEHNLKNVSIEIEKNKLVVFTGVSGSGKSSLIFDTIYAEAFRRFAEASSAPLYIMGGSWQVLAKRPKFKAISGLPPALGLSQRQGVAGRLSTVGTICGVSDLLRVYYAAFGEVSCRVCNIPLRATPFSQLMESIFQEFTGKSLIFIAPIVEKRKGAFGNEIERYRQLGFAKIRVNGKIYNLQDDSQAITLDAKKLNTIEVLIDKINISTDKTKRIERVVAEALEHGKGILKLEDDENAYKYNTKSTCPQCGESAPNLDPRHFSHSSLGQCEVCEGVGSENPEFPVADLFPCSACEGARLSTNIPNVNICGKTYPELQVITLAELMVFAEEKLIPHAGVDKAKLQVVTEIVRVISTINKLKIGHLTLGRAGSTLGPGDLQRLRLSSMLANKLQGALYVLDEPCQGLTESEVNNLVTILRELIVNGGSIVAVEHHPVFLNNCDIVYTMGPGAGLHGGLITDRQENSPQNLERIKNIISPPVLKSASKEKEYLKFQEIKIRNVKKNELYIPQECITLIRGKAGKGKTSFFELCLGEYLKEHALIKDKDEKKISHKYFENFCKVTRSPGLTILGVEEVKPGSIIRSSRKTVASALDILVPLRELFAKLPQSQVMGLSSSHFSFFSKLGRCPNCEGRGYIELPNRYAPPVDVECETCLGAKLNSRSLIPRLRGLNFAEIMELEVSSAYNIFVNNKIIAGRLSNAMQFGLGYVKLGQGMDSLSGGELQRLILTLELRRVNLAGFWFLLYQPGTGLHKPDIEILGKLLRQLVLRGATFILVENREEFIEFADSIIEF